MTILCTISLALIPVNKNNYRVLMISPQEGPTVNLF